jgi:hypothetical protein
MLRARSAHHQERQNFTNTASGNSHSMLVAEMCESWKSLLPTRTHATNTVFGNNHSKLLPKAVLVQFVSPDDEHCVLETCREL